MTTRSEANRIKVEEQKRRIAYRLAVLHEILKEPDPEYLIGLMLGTLNERETGIALGLPASTVTLIERNALRKMRKAFVRSELRVIQGGKE